MYLSLYAKVTQSWSSATPPFKFPVLTFSSLVSWMMLTSSVGGSRPGWLLNRLATKARFRISCPCTTSWWSDIGLMVLHKSMTRLQYHCYIQCVSSNGYLIRLMGFNRRFRINKIQPLFCSFITILTSSRHSLWWTGEVHLISAQPLMKPSFQTTVVFSKLLNVRFYRPEKKNLRHINIVTSYCAVCQKSLDQITKSSCMKVLWIYVLYISLIQKVRNEQKVTIIFLLFSEFHKLPSFFKSLQLKFAFVNNL